MSTSLKVRNIVLVGSFNPSTFDKYFFIKNRILQEEEILPNSLFESIGVNLLSAKFQITITFNQFIINSFEDKIIEILVSIIKAANISKVTALGFNFNWFLTGEGKSIEQISKNYFYSDKINLFSKYFDTADAMFGVYASKNIKDARLKLDIKPSVFQEINNPDSQNIIHIVFNFHFDIKNKDGSELLKYLNDYDYYTEENKKIVSLYS